MDKKACLGAMRGLVRIGVLPAPLGERLEQVVRPTDLRGSGGGAALEGVAIPCAPVSREGGRAAIEGRLFYIPDATVGSAQEGWELDVYSPCTPGRRQPTAAAYRAMHEVLTLLSGSDDVEGITHADVLRCLTTSFVTMPPLQQAAFTALLTRYYAPPAEGGVALPRPPPSEPFQIFLVPRAANP